jgi:hypothetical protein
MSPRSLSWSVPTWNDMDIQLIVACVVYILPTNKIRLVFLVYVFTENKTEAAGARGWVSV